MPQKLIQAVNQLTVTASYLNSAYEKKFGFKHYGFDCVGSSTIWAQGNGVVLAKGLDNCYGNYVVVMYFDVEGKGNIITNYFHLAQPSNRKEGDFVNSLNSQLGVMGTTGTYSTGVHLHTEMRVYTQGEAELLSPFGTSHFVKSLNAAWFDPLDVIYTKNTSPDNQSFATRNDAYINADNKIAKYIIGSAIVPNAPIGAAASDTALIKENASLKSELEKEKDIRKKISELVCGNG